MNGAFFHRFMDLLESIREKLIFFSDTDNYLGLQSVVSHIEAAEHHLEMGRKGDDYYFTDVIYRTNQAFEGALKEAYVLLAKNGVKDKSPYQIEKYLESEKLLEERVLSLFSNYRMEWRNKSTHNHKLYFSAQEAFLAIVNISAFFHILLDQMIEAKAYFREQEKLKNSKIKLSDSYLEQPLIKQITEVLTSFSRDISSKIATGSSMPELFDTPKLFEQEILGKLAAYLNKADPEIEVFIEYPIST